MTHTQQTTVADGSLVDIFGSLIFGTNTSYTAAFISETHAGRMQTASPDCSLASAATLHPGKPDGGRGCKKNKTPLRRACCSRPHVPDAGAANSKLRRYVLALTFFKVFSREENFLFADQPSVSWLPVGAKPGSHPCEPPKIKWLLLLLKGPVSGFWSVFFYIKEEFK